MSRGLGKVQRAVLDVLRGHPSGIEMIDLPARVFHSDRYPSGELESSDWMAYMDARQEIAVSRAEYVSAFRAVQALERAGLVKTEICTPKPIAGYLPPSAVRWKLVRLSVDKEYSLSTLNPVQVTAERGTDGRIYIDGLPVVQAIDLKDGMMSLFMEASNDGTKQTLHTAKIRKEDYAALLKLEKEEAQPAR